MIDFESRLVEAIDNNKESIQISYWRYAYIGNDDLYELCEAISIAKGVNITFEDLSAAKSDKFDLVFYIEY